MNLHSEQEGIEDRVLENYIVLWKHIIGIDKRFYVKNKRKTPKVNKITFDRKCPCGTKFDARYYGQKYCGNRDLKEGCAYKRYMMSFQNSKEARLRNRAENQLFGNPK